MDASNRIYSGPISFLPPLSQLHAYSSSDFAEALRNLRELYWPTAHSFPTKLSIPQRNLLRRPRHDHLVPDSGYASAVQSDDESEDENSATFNVYKPSETLELLRGDPFERAYAIKWITGFIGRCDTWVPPGGELFTDDARNDIIDEATALLSLFSASSEDDAGYAVTRTFSFASPSSSGGTRSIEVQLNDAPLSSVDHTSVGLQSWGSAVLLAECICATPHRFELPIGDEKGRPLRVLELGAGTGLLSIVVAKLVRFLSVSVIATDYHPDVLANLTANVHANFPSTPISQLPVQVHVLDWQCPDSTHLLHDNFDIILAADVIYHPEHAAWIKGCVERMLAKPGSGEGKLGGVFWLIIPLRESGRYEGMERTVDAVFPDASRGFSPSVNGVEVSQWELRVLEREEAGRQSSGVGRADEGGYKLFRIGWSSSVES